MPEYIDVVCSSSSFGDTILKHLFYLFWPKKRTYTHPAMEGCLKYPHPSRLLFLVITAFCHFSITNKNLLGDAVFSHGKLEFDGVERCKHAVWPTTGWRRPDPPVHLGHRPEPLWWWVHIGSKSLHDWQKDLFWGSHPVIPGGSTCPKLDAFSCGLTLPSWMMKNLYDIYIYVCMHACMYVCMYIDTYIYICIYIYVYLCIYIYVYICICIYVYMCICI